jgi:hypothetical protein
MRLNANINHLSRFRLIIAATALLALVGSATVASVHWMRAASGKSARETAVVSQPVQQPNNLEAQRITLRPTGFEPAEVTRPAGRFLLAINDRSGQRDASFILLRQNGERLREVRMRDTPRKHEWREIVNLPPGRYLLADSANPERVCQILLTN